MIEPELTEAVESYFDKLKAAVVARLEMGERSYRDGWKKLSLDQLRTEREEEILDVVAYSLVIAWREKAEQEEQEVEDAYKRRGEICDR